MRQDRLPAGRRIPDGASAQGSGATANGGIPYLPVQVTRTRTWDNRLDGQNVRMTITAAATAGAVLTVPTAQAGGAHGRDAAHQHRAQGVRAAGHQPTEMIIHTRIGAAHLIARQAPLALLPAHPRLLHASPPPDPHALRGAVNTSLSGLFLLLAAICLVIGAPGIANTTLVAILERTKEIGLRRSLGARPRHIAAQFLTESTTLGTLGGLIGTAIGVCTVLTVALVQHWTAIVDPMTVLPAPLVGSVVGLPAGLYPALRAARIEPLEALRQ